MISLLGRCRVRCRGWRSSRRSSVRRLRAGTRATRAARSLGVRRGTAPCWRYIRRCRRAGPKPLLRSCRAMRPDDGDAVSSGNVLVHAVAGLRLALGVVDGRDEESWRADGTPEADRRYDLSLDRFLINHAETIVPTIQSDRPHGLEARGIPAAIRWTINRRPVGGQACVSFAKRRVVTEPGCAKLVAASGVAPVARALSSRASRLHQNPAIQR